MKKLITAFSFFFCTHVVFSQTVASSCSAPDSIEALYMKDANRLALRKIYAQGLTYTNSINIPPSHTDTILKALLSVYNATLLPARNTVINQYNIHSFPNPDMSRLYVSADSNLAWMQQLRLGNIPTGNTQIDNLMSGYYFTIQNYSTYSGFFSYHTVTLNSDSSYNLPPLTTLFEAVPGVTYSNPASTVGSGNDITASVYPTYVQLVYSIGWDDCPSSCLSRHYWTFKVYYDCSVEYAGESGTFIPTVAAPTISVSGSNCSDATLTVTIAGADSYSLNSQPLSATQFTLSSPIPASYSIFASHYGAFPAVTQTTSASVSIINCGTSTSIHENKRHSNLSIYPNPANERVELVMDNCEAYNDFTSLSVYNSLGSLARKEDIAFKDQRIILNTSGLAEGAYFIVISKSTNERLIKKLLIAR